MAAVIGSGNIDNGVTEIDDDQLALLDKEKSDGSQNKSATKTGEKQKKKKKQMTFCKWLWQKPWSKIPFIYMLVGIVAVPGLAIFHFMDPDTSFIICGAYIFLNIWALKYFYTIIGLKVVCIMHI